MMKNKRGFIKIVEAFIAVLLVAGVLLFVVSRNTNVLDSTQTRIDEIEKSILLEVSQNSNYRDNILAVNDEQELNQNSADGLGEIWRTVDIRVPDELDFRIKICKLENICALDNYPEKDVYTRAVSITSNITTYHPKQFKIWIWVK